MKRINIFLLITCICLIAIAGMCSEEDLDGHEFITFRNLSDSAIYVIQKHTSSTSSKDTFYQCYHGWHRIIKANDSLQLTGGFDSWELEFKYYPHMQFFIFSDVTPLHDCNEDSIQSYTRKYLLKRYEMTKEKMEELNWTITYP